MIYATGIVAAWIMGIGVGYVFTKPKHRKAVVKNASEGFEGACKMKLVFVNGSKEEAHSDLFEVTPAVEDVISQLHSQMVDGVAGNRLLLERSGSL